MGNIKKINLEQALDITPNYYKPSIQYLYESALLPNEQVVFIGKATKHKLRTETGWSSIKGDVKTTEHYTNLASLIILTNLRWIRKETVWSNDQGLLFANKEEKEGFFKSWKSGYRWSEPFTENPPDKKDNERKGKSLEEWAMSNIVFTHLDKIHAKNKRIRFTNQNNQQMKYLLIEVSGGQYSLLFDKGEELFNLLQEAAANGGKLFLDDDKRESKMDNDTTIQQKLQQLKEFFEADLITESEYNQKREELLSSF